MKDTGFPETYRSVSGQLWTAFFVTDRTNGIHSSTYYVCLPTFIVLVKPTMLVSQIFSLFFVVVWHLCWRESDAFSIPSSSENAVSIVPTSAESGESTRRGFFARTVQQTGSSMAALGMTNWWTPLSAVAVTGVNKVDAKLRAYGLPPLGPVPNGFTPLLELYGKGRNRFPVLVSFIFPLSWVVTLPSNDANGEDGTVQAGEYAKGDTATFFLYSDLGHVDNIATAPKELFEKALIKSISQKGDNMYQNFKVTKLEPVKVDGQSYVLADFKYQLLTGAGFEVDRKGVASITSQGPAVEVLWAASTAVRYKKTEEDLRKIVSSFRCYTDGLNFSEELL